MQASNTLEFARRVLREVYGKTGTVRPLHGELDCNLAVAHGEQRFVLKIMRPGCDDALVQMQCAAIAHLEKARPALPLPRVIPTVGGRTFDSVDDPEGQSRLVWLQSWLAGSPLSGYCPVPRATLTAAGSALGDLVTGLADFDHPACSRNLRWNLGNAQWIGEHLSCVDNWARQAIIRRVHARYCDEVLPALTHVRQTVIHGDANTDNLLASAEGSQCLTLTGIIDFGDMCRSPLVAEVAIACAYAMMGAQRPVAAAEAVVAGFHERCALQPEELALLMPLLLMRLAVSVTVSALEKQRRPDDPYVTISEEPAWHLLEAFADADADLLEGRLRLACGLAAAPGLDHWSQRISACAKMATRVLDTRTSPADAPIIDCSFESTAGGDDPLSMSPADMAVYVNDVLAKSGADCVVGRYGEPRPLYTSAGFCDPQQPMGPRRTVHLGLDLFAAAGTRVHAPLDGTVSACGFATGELDYGGYVILRHGTGSAAFDTVYGHLDPESIAHLAPGDALPGGNVFAALGSPEHNGGWPAHLHFQIAARPRHWPVPSTPPGVARPEDFAAMSALFPNPAALLGVAPRRVTWQPPDAADKAARRRRHFTANLRLSYSAPLMPVRGRRHHLFDGWGRVYLDAYNNVPHVGHCHPAVVDAASRQMRLLNTNTRYLHDTVLEYAQRLSALMPAPLSACFFVNSASEANELALRLARAHTGARDMLVMDHGYHGNTTGALSISPYKFRHMGGPEDWVQVTPQPDVYRGCYRAGSGDAGGRYADDVAAVLKRLVADGRRPAGYICEAVPSVGGQIVLPEGFLSSVYRAVRAAGGVCICDDVQTGLGRLGSVMWGFELGDVTPDIVVLGKPLGNGHPLAAVVTTQAIADSFGQQVEFFSTFGGNTVSCAVGLAVLDALEGDALVANARSTGALLKAGLAELQQRHALIGDVRGDGLFLGVELVNHRNTLEPATRQASYVTNRMRERRVLIGTEGPHDNVLKIRPPMTFDAAAVEYLLSCLDTVLAENAAQPRTNH